jgi:hypothetical protein
MDQCSKDLQLMRHQQVPLVVPDHHSKPGATVQLDLPVKLEHQVWTKKEN